MPSTITVIGTGDGLGVLTPIAPGVFTDTTLRGAINFANDTSGQDLITFAPRVHGTIWLDETLGELQITDGLTISGPGAGKLAVSGNDKVRVFHTGTDTPGTETTVAIAGLTITHGWSETHETRLHSHGGGILNDTYGILMLTDVVLSHNTAKGIEDVSPPDELRHLGGGAGGGVANTGRLTVTGCTFLDNHALAADYTDGVFAVKPPNQPPLQPPRLDLVRFPGIALGGGLWNWKTGTATVTDSRFIDNLAKGGDNCTGTFAGVGQGGAIYNDNDLTVTGSLFSDNQAVGGSQTTPPTAPTSDIYGGPAVGGAISSGTNERLLPGETESAVLNVSQCIFRDNQALGGNQNLAGPQGVLAGAGTAAGGGIFVFQGEATISRSVLDHNQAIGGEGAAGRVGGLAVGGGILFINFLPGVTGQGVTGTVEGCALAGNEARGGIGGDGGRGGNAQGGGLAAGGFGSSSLPLPGKVEVSNTLVAGNLARGGDGGTGGAGGDGQGGGVFNYADSMLTVTSSILILNQAIGGAGTTGGNGLGGGLYNNGDASFGGGASLSKSLIAFNRAKGGAADPGGKVGTAEGGGVYNNLAQGADISIDALTAIFLNLPDNRFGC